MLHATLHSNVARDAIWYPDVGTLYYIFVPEGILHTFINQSPEDFEIVAFFTNANPIPEVSLSVATAFFPAMVRQQSMTQFSLENKPGEPLKNMNYSVTPYLISCKS